MALLLTHPVALRLALAAGALVFSGLGCQQPGKPAPAKVAQPSPPALPSIGADTSAQLRACCKQCVDASGRDPAGFDISRKACAAYLGDFRGSPGVEASCSAVLGEQKATVRSCQAVLDRK